MKYRKMLEYNGLLQENKELRYAANLFSNDAKEYYTELCDFKTACLTVKKAGVAVISSSGWAMISKEYLAELELIKDKYMFDKQAKVCYP